MYTVQGSQRWACFSLYELTKGLRDEVSGDVASFRIIGIYSAKKGWDVSQTDRTLNFTGRTIEKEAVSVASVTNLTRSLSWGKSVTSCHKHTVSGFNIVGLQQRGHCCSLEMMLEVSSLRLSCEISCRETNCKNKKECCLLSLGI